MAKDLDEAAPNFADPNYGKTFTVADEGGGFFSDLFTGQGLKDLASSAGFAAPFFAPFAIGAAGAGFGAAGAAEGAGALGFGAEAGAGEAGLGSWFSGLGEGGLVGGGEAAGGGSDLLALTAPETSSAWPGLGLEGAAGGEAAPIGLAGDYSGAIGGAEGSAILGGGETASAPGFWDKLVSGATSSLTKNPLGIASAAFGLGKNILGGSKGSPELDALRNQAGALGGQAGQLNAQGQQLASYLQSGTLPPGLQTSVDQAAKAYKARIIQNHAKNGMSTDPRQNSALSAELAQADINAVMMTAKIGQDLLASGTQFLNMGMQAQGLSSKIYEGLIRLDREQSKATGVAIANFASALSGGGGFKMAA